MTQADPATLAAIDEVLDLLFATYDGRHVVAVLAMRAARGYQTLRVAGFESEANVRKIYDYLLATSLEAPKVAPRVIYESEAPERKQ